MGSHPRVANSVGPLQRRRLRQRWGPDGELVHRRALTKRAAEAALSSRVKKERPMSWGLVYRGRGRDQEGSRHAYGERTTHRSTTRERASCCSESREGVERVPERETKRWAALGSMRG